jgi:hypothetical protein
MECIGVRYDSPDAIASPRRTVKAILLVNIFERKQEARNPFFRVVEI